MTFAYENGSQTSTINEKPSRVRRRTREEEKEDQPAAPSIAHGPSPAFDASTRQRVKQRQQREQPRNILERARDNDARSFGWRTDFALGAPRHHASESRPPPCKYLSSRRNQYFSAFFSVLFSLVLVGQGSRVPVASARNYRQLQHQLPSSNGGGSGGGPNHHHPFPSSFSNAAPPFPRQLSHPEAPKVSRLRKSAVAGNGGGKTSSTTTEPPASTTTDEPDIIPVWLSLDKLNKYNYTSLTRYGDVCPAMAPRAPPLPSFDHDRTIVSADTSNDWGAPPTEVSAASRGKASSPSFHRELVSNLQCLPLDENAINALCSSGAYTCSSRGYGPRVPPNGDSAAVASDRWGSVHLSFCSRYNLTSLIPDKTRDKIRDNKTLCESTLRTLVTLDNTSRALDCEFDTVIARYDCDTGYSVNSNCSYCKKAYRKWVCAMMLPFHAKSRRVKACRSFCHLVEQRCPYFHPFIKEQYAGEPAFKCIDRNIPDIPDLTPKSAYGGDNECYTACDLDTLDNDDPVLNCRREERTAKKGRGESLAMPSATTTERVSDVDSAAPGQPTTTSGVTTRTSVDAFEQPDTKTERYRTGTRPTEEPRGSGREGGGNLALSLPPDQDVSANHSTRHGTASSDPAAATASMAAATDATPGASPSNSAATSTSTTYLLLEPWIVATSGAMASLLVTLILTSRVRYRPRLARTSSYDAIATPKTPLPAATSKTRAAKTGPYRRRRYESRRRRLRPRYLVTD